MRHRVLLVREWDAQTSGSGCCGRLGGETQDLCDASLYGHNRHEMERAGRLYRALRAALGGDVDVVVADPRNMLWLVPAIWRDARRAGLSPSEAWTQVRRGVAYTSIVCDGKVLYSGNLPDVDEGVAAVVERIRRAEAA